MKQTYIIAGGAIAIVVLAVLLVPGLGDSIEAFLLRFLAGRL